jgi:hypothetical protein
MVVTAARRGGVTTERELRAERCRGERRRCAEQPAAGEFSHA